MHTWLYLASLLLLLGCGSGDGDENNSTAQGLVCGKDRCTTDQICVATRGAFCMPLPPPGGSCQAGCVLTEHCCNCTAHACFTPPAQNCGGSPTCDCVASGFLDQGCPAERRECSESARGVEVLCVNVDYDEDPFADAGADDAASADGGATDGASGSL